MHTYNAQFVNGSRDNTTTCPQPLPPGHCASIIKEFIMLIMHTVTLFIEVLLTVYGLVMPSVVELIAAAMALVEVIDIGMVLLLGVLFVKIVALSDFVGILYGDYSRVLS